MAAFWVAMAKGTIRGGQDAMGVGVIGAEMRIDAPDGSSLPEEPRRTPRRGRKGRPRLDV